MWRVRVAGPGNEKPPTSVDGKGAGTGARHPLRNGDYAVGHEGDDVVHGPFNLAGARAGSIGRATPRASGAGEPGRGSRVVSLESMEQAAQLTPQAHQRLVDELEHRSGAHRREISEKIERAREHGDISENADYDAAKNEQGLNEARIRHLEQILKTAQIVEAAVGDTVATGMLVEIRLGPGADPTTYLVGSIEERHADFDVLSTSAPLGQAILGRSAGDTVSYTTPKGKAVEVEIVGVRPL